MNEVSGIGESNHDLAKPGWVRKWLAPLMVLALMSPLHATAQQSEPQEASTSQKQNDPSSAPPTQGRAKFSGPDSVDRQLEEDAKPGQPLFQPDFLQSYFDLKGNLKEKTGLNFGVDYSGVYLWASESLNHGQAGGGMVRLYGTWDLVGRNSENTGTFIYKVEHRHGYGSIPAADLGFDLGYVGLFNPPFSDQRWRVTNLYWKHRLLEGRFVLMGGFLDATDYVDIYALGSPWLHFSNLVFSTGSASISLPNDAALGFATGVFITDQLYILGGLTDTNSDPTDPFQGFDTFFGDHEYFKSLEVGLTTSRERAYFDNLHVTLWHVDRREQAQVEAGWGTAFSFTLWANDTWLPFVRGGGRQARRWPVATVSGHRLRISEGCRPRSSGSGV